MKPKFSLLMTVYEPWELLPRALACLGQQTWPYWELWLLIDGPCPTGEYDPRRIVHSFRRHQPQHAVELCELPRAAGCFGNVSRHAGLKFATGDYVCWINHDNLIAPDYLATHAANIAQSPGCVSVVGIDYWRGGVCHGPFPRALSRSRIDLLNFSVPTTLARQVQAFGPANQERYAADWDTFAACRLLAPVVQTHRIVGTHF